MHRGLRTDASRVEIGGKTKRKDSHSFPEVQTAARGCTVLLTRCLPRQRFLSVSSLTRAHAQRSGTRARLNLMPRRQLAGHCCFVAEMALDGENLLGITVVAF